MIIFVTNCSYFSFAVHHATSSGDLQSVPQSRQKPANHHTLQRISTGVDIFLSLIFSYFCFFVAAWKQQTRYITLMYADTTQMLQIQPHTHTHTHNHFMALLDFVQDYPGKPIPEG